MIRAADREINSEDLYLYGFGHFTPTSLKCSECQGDDRTRCETVSRISCELVHVACFADGLIQAAGAMIGDQLDAIAMFTSASSLCATAEDTDEDGENEYVLSKDDRDTLAKYASDCVTAFLKIEAAHRVEFGLSDESPTPVSASPTIQFVWLGID